MFKKESVIQAIKIHKLGYKFLLYITDQIDNKKFTFSSVHNGEDQTEVIYNWIKDYYDYLPKSILPEKTALRGFSNYFTSFLKTSFQLVEEPAITNNTGCFCEICLQFSNVSHLKSISPLKYDRRIANEKRVDIVLELAKFCDLSLSEEAATEIANSETHIKNTAYLAYTKALFQRIQTGEGGVFNVALWRTFAWNTNGAPIRGFELKAEDIFSVESNLKQEFINVTGGPFLPSNS